MKFSVNPYYEPLSRFMIRREFKAVVSFNGIVSFFMEHMDSKLIRFSKLEATSCSVIRTISLSTEIHVPHLTVDMRLIDACDVAVQV